jgi:hypothetical protein
LAWDVEYTEGFEAWWSTLSEGEQADVDASVQLLEAYGPQLGRPHVDTVQSSRHSNMKELRTQSGGKPLRTFFAFDPRRTAILLVGGDKTGDRRFYDRMIPIADNAYDEYLTEIEKEGLI